MHPLSYVALTLPLTMHLTKCHAGTLEGYAVHGAVTPARTGCRYAVPTISCVLMPMTAIVVVLMHLDYV